MNAAPYIDVGHSYIGKVQQAALWPSAPHLEPLLPPQRDPQLLGRLPEKDTQRGLYRGSTLQKAHMEPEEGLSREDRFRVSFPECRDFRSGMVEWSVCGCLRDPGELGGT